MSNRLPLLFLPGDVFANRLPDPVLQQIENFGDGTVSANDCFRPVSRYFDRITRPEQIIPALQRAMTVLTDPAECGPVTLALCQDVQAEAFDYPEAFFAEHVWLPRRSVRTDANCRRGRDARAAHRTAHHRRRRRSLFRRQQRPRGFAEAHRIPVAETQAGKSSLSARPSARHGLDRRQRHVGRKHSRRQADVILAVGTRLQDFTTGSWALFRNDRQQSSNSTRSFSTPTSTAALPLVGDARAGLRMLAAGLGAHRAPDAGRNEARERRAQWRRGRRAVTGRDQRRVLPTRR